MNTQSFAKFALALTLAMGLSTAAMAAEHSPTTTTGKPTPAADTTAAHAAATTKTKEQCESLTDVTARTQCLKQVKEQKAEATIGSTAPHGAHTATDHNHAHQ